MYGGMERRAEILTTHEEHPEKKPRKQAREPESSQRKKDPFGPNSEPLTVRGPSEEDRLV